MNIEINVREFAPIIANAVRDAVSEAFAEQKKQAATKPAAKLEPALVTPDEAAEMLRVSPRRLWTLRKQQGLPFVKLGDDPAGHVHYRPEDLRAFAASRRVIEGAATADTETRNQAGPGETQQRGNTIKMRRPAMKSSA
jgi:Helix-turn-helix domain